MKHYIILTGGIHDMGGAEMFTRNKVIFLKNNGWHVNVFYYNKGKKILLSELKEYEDNFIPELQNGYYYFSKRQREAIISKLYKGIDKNDIVIIESQLLGLSYWAELASLRYGAKSILNCMEENIPQISYNESIFLEYKLKRNEILNGSERSYPRYFGKFLKPEYNNYVNHMVPFCSNVISEGDEKIDLPIADFNLLSIGRLNKPYIQNVIDGVKKFTTSQNNRTFNFLIIGGSPDGSVEKQIDELFDESPNVNIVHFGYMFPIPANIIRQADVAMATANSVLVSSDLGVPTIAYSIYDFMPLGVYGYSTNNKFQRDDEPIVATESLLEEILVLHKYTKDENPRITQKSLEEIFLPQIEFLSKSPNDNMAYNVMKIHSHVEQIIANIKRIILYIIGRPLYKG